MTNIWGLKYAAGDSLNKYPWDKIVSFVFRYYPRAQPKNDTKILELGFGSGCNLWFCAREGFDCYGVEWSEVAVNHAKDWFLKENLNADLKQGNFSPLDFKSDFFDLIIDRASLTCVSSNECIDSLREVFRVLKPGGYFCFSPYSSQHTSYIEGDVQDSGMTRVNTGTLVNVGDLKFYDEEEITKMVLDAGFKVHQIRHVEEKFLSAKEGVHAEWFVVLGK